MAQRLAELMRVYRRGDGRQAYAERSWYLEDCLFHLRLGAVWDGAGFSMRTHIGNGGYFDSAATFGSSCGRTYAKKTVKKKGKTKKARLASTTMLASLACHPAERAAARLKTKLYGLHPALALAALFALRRRVLGKTRCLPPFWL